MDLPKIVFLVQ